MQFNWLENKRNNTCSTSICAKGTSMCTKYWKGDQQKLANRSMKSAEVCIKNLNIYTVHQTVNQSKLF